ncbi:MAG TPA: DUF402 domain-containing protein [Anaerolineales bacterium]|nr:DUF402 domain-containing protein [Anaerolineales bacterium]
MTAVLICKCNLAGETTLTWQGELLHTTPQVFCVKAIFTLREQLDLGYTVFQRGDIFIEWFYTDRYYAIYEIWSAGQTELKGWYCNFARPAKRVGDEIRSLDLALDVWVNGNDGTCLILDQAEFDALPLASAERQAVLDGLADLQLLANTDHLPRTLGLS